MTPDHARFAEWDAAYVLGALSASDRLAYEDHLAECSLCSRAVAEIAPTVGLLSRAAASATLSEEKTQPDAGRRTHLASLAARRARGRKRWWVAGAAAAVAVVVAAVAAPLTVSGTVEQGPAHALSNVVEAPLEASVRLTSVEWGTRIDLVCEYSGQPLDATEGGWPYALAVVDADGASTTLSTWRAAPGTTTQLSAGTDLRVADIGAVEIRTITGDKALMRYAP